MKTLIIHPEDKTTIFLKIIYQDIENKTVISGGVNDKELRQLISNHDRVMMMGHGSPFGLFNRFSAFPEISRGLIIDSSLVPLLNQKNNSVFIWCNADQFVNRNGLKGFYSGMFISEVTEAKFCGLKDVQQKTVDESNEQFCDIFAKTINQAQDEAFQNVLEKYGQIAKRNVVAQYNHQRLFLKK